MDLEPLQKGVTQFLLVLSSTVATTFSSGQPAKTAPSIVQTPKTEQSIVLPKPALYNEISASTIPETDYTAIDPPDSVLTESEVLGHETTLTSQLVAKPTLTPSPTPTATATPTPTKVIKPTATPTSYKTPMTKTTAGASLSADLIFELINNHRASLKLPAFEKEETLCQIAQYRAPQLQGEIANGTIHKGFYDLNLPFWATENMAYYPSEQQNMNFWLGSYIHRSAIEGNYRYSCGACSGNACIQIFTNYIPK